MKVHCPTCGQPQFKRQPAFSSELRKYPNAEPVFITTTWDCVNFIRNSGGTCLLCNYSPQQYSLDICSEKEVWILTQNNENEQAPTNLESALLQHGATKVKIIPIDGDLL